MGKSVVVLGGGMVGRVMAMDLARDPELQVSLADVAPERLGAMAAHKVLVVGADLSRADTVRSLADGADLVVGALPSQLGLQTVETLIDMGRDYCDITFMPEDPWELDARAKAAGVTMLVDAGVAPGMSNHLAGRAVRILDRTDFIGIYVGGLPVARTLPWQYKAAFSPSDVIEEYTRPVRVVEGGRVVVKEPLGEAEFLDFAGVGTLEGRLTDGLRSLAATLDVPEMVEKTLRYPGHYELMDIYRRAGFFGTEPIELPSGPAVPRELFKELVFPDWSYAPGEADLTVMRVIARGERGGRPTTLQWDLDDRLDPATGTTSMARTTGFTCTVLARELLSGRLRRPGVHPLEAIADDDALHQRILAGLAERGVHYSYTEHTA